MKKKNATDDSLATFTSSPHIRLVGMHQCVVDGLKGIMEYSDENIKINLGKYAIRVSGSGLSINDFSPQGAIIQGTILVLEMCDAG